MDPLVAYEARAAIASARELLRDFLEEGVHGYDRADTDALAAAVTNAASTPSIAVDEPAPTPEPQPAAATEPAHTDTTRPVPAAAANSPEAEDAIAWNERPTLDEVQRTLGDCNRCGLSAGRNRIVFGDGNPDADLMFIGEGPGQEEDRRGLPFVGRAGELLTQMIEKGLGLKRSEVYICNIVKCRPPKNRTPLDNEVATCSPFLQGQIAAVRPKVIVSLGKPSTSLLLGRDVAITRLRGSWHEYQGIPLMPTLHPAYVLRQYTPDNRRHVWEDLKAALAKSREGTSG